MPPSLFSHRCPLSKSQSYILSHFPVPDSVFYLFDGELSSLSPECRRFFRHLLASSLIQGRKRNDWGEPGVELPSQTIDQHFGTSFSWVPLVRAGLLNVSGYSPALHKCRRYEIMPGWLEQAFSRMDIATAEASKERQVDLFTGEPFFSTPPPYRDEDPGIVTRLWVREAAARISTCPFNGDALDAHLEALRERYRQADPEEKARARGRLKNDTACARFRFGC